MPPSITQRVWYVLASALLMFTLCYTSIASHRNTSHLLSGSHYVLLHTIDKSAALHRDLGIKQFLRAQPTFAAPRASDALLMSLTQSELRDHWTQSLHLKLRVCVFVVLRVRLLSFCSIRFQFDYLKSRAARQRGATQYCNAHSFNLCSSHSFRAASWSAICRRTCRSRLCRSGTLTLCCFASSTSTSRSRTRNARRTSHSTFPYVFLRLGLL